MMMDGIRYRLKVLARSEPLLTLYRETVVSRSDKLGLSITH